MKLRGAASTWSAAQILASALLGLFLLLLGGGIGVGVGYGWRGAGQPEKKTEAVASVKPQAEKEAAPVKEIGSVKEKAKAVVKDKTVAAPAKKSPMTITFAGGMKFFGRSTNMKGQPAARAEFYKDVHAETDDSSLDCEDVMRTYFDQLVLRKAGE